MRSTRFLLVALVAIVSVAPAWATRMREALERFELSELTVWHVSLNGNCGPRVSFLDPQNYVYTVPLGSYVGKLDGRLTRVTKHEILIVEIRPDGDNYKEVEVRIPVPEGAWRD